MCIYLIYIYIYIYISIPMFWYGASHASDPLGFRFASTGRSTSRIIHYSLRNTVLSCFSLTDYPLFMQDYRGILEEYSTFVLLRSFTHHGSCFLIGKYSIFPFLRSFPHHGSCFLIDKYSTFRFSLLYAHHGSCFLIEK